MFFFSEEEDDEEDGGGDNAYSDEELIERERLINKYDGGRSSSYSAISPQLSGSGSEYISY